MRIQIAAANWKMNLTLEEGMVLLKEIMAEKIQLKASQKVIFAVPFPYILPATERIVSEDNYFIAAQNCYNKPSGAFTGEVSAAMLESVGIRHVIIGHSERREYFNESHKVLAEKIDLCFEHGLTAIFCCGEPLNIRESQSQNEYVSNQLKESLFHLDAAAIEKLIIAYEPIWAIGTGKTASAEQAQEMHAHIRKTIADQYLPEVADRISILYGGSVKGSNANELFSKPDVDGGLVGGAALNSAEFTTIIKSLQ
ncbi:triose-phosphate isomerase [soil metagenome]